jgi:hypothetical protein
LGAFEGETPMSHGTEHHLEHAEHAQHQAHNPFDRQVAMSMAIMAAVLAGVTLVSHRGHTETLRLATEAGSYHTQASDAWNLYQAKNIRSHEFQSYLILEELVSRDGPRQDADAKGLRNYWISQINKYEGEDFWQRFRESLRGQKAKAKVEDAENHGSTEAQTGHDKPTKQEGHGSGDTKPKSGKVARGKNSELDELTRQSQELEAKAKKFEHESHKIHEDVWWTDMGHLGLELGLVMCAVAVLTKQRFMWLVGILFGIAGTVVAAYGCYSMWFVKVGEVAGGHG